MDSSYAFNCKGFRNTRHSNIWNTIVELFFKHDVQGKMGKVPVLNLYLCDQQCLRRIHACSIYRCVCVLCPVA
jgi:hypothetical protein